MIYGHRLRLNAVKWAIIHLQDTDYSWRDVAGVGEDKENKIVTMMVYTGTDNEIKKIQVPLREVPSYLEENDPNDAGGYFKTEDEFQEWKDKRTQEINAWCNENSYAIK